jgi:RNA polymerase sigma-70 factor, ECF subfamily
VRERHDRYIRELESGAQGPANQLIRQIKEDQKSGGSQGLLDLSNAFRARIISFQTKILNGNREAATEAWNDTLVDIWERIDSYDPRRSTFRTWVYNTARYQALARKRRHVRDQRRSVSEPDPDHHGMAAAFELPEPLTDRESAALQRAFRRLKPTQRELLWFRFIEGWLPSEIVREGLVQGVSAESVRVYINRAATRLRELFESELTV